MVVGILGFSGSASADWQGLVWGMSRKEADNSFQVPHDRERHQLWFNYTAGNFAFDMGKIWFDPFVVTESSTGVLPPSREFVSVGEYKVCSGVV